jgi:hypothetical protein
LIADSERLLALSLLLVTWSLCRSRRRIQSITPITYASSSSTVGNLGGVVPALTKSRLINSHSAHLDPNLRIGAISRPGKPWIPAFGQSIATAVAALDKPPPVVKGDLFLFYGLFSEVSTNFPYRNYQSPISDLNVIFGWLQVEQVQSRYHPPL